ncbi:hypothetical protein ENSA5_13860 [Enhygromyxa salina]|uniref:Uncharacterized protein n=1 Tax=Enhygromyxa salina TaxID=215803 RepID=A0A2S9YF26_9BACT|nr:hypothetical protein [Enhygromyxa salina]PRQ03631.1 hypothetical protein ENSA5_13860 [Enhygromyxa salina]
MAEIAVLLANKARRAALIQTVRGRPELTIEQLEGLLDNGEYAEELQQITVRELVRHQTHTPALEVQAGESVEDAVLRVFHHLPDQRLTSGFFRRYMGLERWTAQKVLADMADRGLLVRSGKTSGTRYSLSQESGGG